MKKLLFIIANPVAFSVTSCMKAGCTDPIASNYTDAAKKDDASCAYSNNNFLFNNIMEQYIQQ